MALKVWSASDTVAAADINGNFALMTTLPLSVASTGLFSQVQGARVQRLNDRQFVGGATVNAGNFSGEGGTYDWLELIRVNTTCNTQFAVLSTIGQTGILGGSRSSDYPTAGSMGCIGIQGWAINNNATQVQSVYAGYFEARRYAGAGITHGIEVDVANLGGTVAITPYSMFPPGLTAAMWLAAGGGLTSGVCSAAMAILDNGQTFQTGIVFKDGAIVSLDALLMASGHRMTWVNSSSTPVARVHSIATTASMQMSFVNGAMLFSDMTPASPTNVMQLFNTGYLTLYGSGPTLNVGSTGSTASAVDFHGGAGGSAATYDARLLVTNGGTSTSGLGWLQVVAQQLVYVGAQTSGTAGTLAGYLVTGVNGVVQKIPYYNV